MRLANMLREYRRELHLMLFYDENILELNTTLFPKNKLLFYDENILELNIT